MMCRLGNHSNGSALAAALIVAISLCLGIPRAAAQGGTAGVCFCDERGGIGIAQLIGAVNVALGTADCPGSPPAEAIAQGQVGIAGVCFCDASGTIAISQLIRAVSVALGVAYCAIIPTIPTPTSTPATPTVDSYGDCRAGGPCAPGEFCFTNGDSAVCVPQGCGVVADCPARPPSSSAPMELATARATV